MSGERPLGAIGRMLAGGLPAADIMLDGMVRVPTSATGEAIVCGLDKAAA